MRVHHLAVVVRDLDRSEAFYRSILGAEVIARHADAEGRPRAVWLGLDDGAFLALEVAHGPGRRVDVDPGWHCVAFRIAPGEREATRARLTAAGHPILRESAFTLYVRGPDDELVGFSHHPVALSSSGAS